MPPLHHTASNVSVGMSLTSSPGGGVSIAQKGQVKDILNRKSSLLKKLYADGSIGYDDFKEICKAIADKYPYSGDEVDKVLVDNMLLEKLKQSGLHE
eukprot:4743728-Prymnesium_polylepis.1